MAGHFNSISGSKRSLHVQVAREIARGILSGDLPQGSIIQLRFINPCCFTCRDTFF